jgi:hypothetical protein
VTPDEHYDAADTLLAQLAADPDELPENLLVDATRAAAHATLATVDRRAPDAEADARRELRDRVERQRAELADRNPDAPPPRVAGG